MRGRRPILERLLLAAVAVWLAAWLLQSAAHMVLSVLPIVLGVGLVAGIGALLWIRYRHSDRW